MTVADLLKTLEGFRGSPYEDSEGFPTIGYGTKLPIDEAEGELLLDNRLAPLVASLEVALPWMPQLDGVREAAMQIWAYQLGVAGVLEFHHALTAIAANDWQSAYEAMLQSKWATQTPARAKEVATMILTGQWPGEDGVA